MKRVLVTGGSGYIGRHLLTALVGAGVSVRATIRAQASGQTLAALGAEVVPWSMEDATFPYDCLTGIDTCFHLVAPRRTFDQVTQSTRRPGDPVLAQGSERLAAAIAATDVERLIVTSSATVYGKCWGEVDEATPVKPEGLYSQTRGEAEMLCREAFAATPGQLVIARLTERPSGPAAPVSLDF